MKPNKVRLIKIIWDVLKRHELQDLALAREILEALVSEKFFENLK